MTEQRMQEASQGFHAAIDAQSNPGSVKGKIDRSPKAPGNVITAPLLTVGTAPEKPWKPSDDQG